MDDPSFLDKLSRPHPTLLEPQILQILIIVHLTLLIALVLIYYLIKFRMFHSVQGPSNDAKGSNYKPLQTSFFHIFLGLSIITMNNLLVQILSLRSVSTYPLVGTDSIIFNFGLGLFFMGTLTFICELNEIQHLQLVFQKEIFLYGIFGILSVNSLLDNVFFRIITISTLIGIHIFLVYLLNQLKSGLDKSNLGIINVRVDVILSIILFSLIILPTLIFFDTSSYSSDTRADLLMVFFDGYIMVIALTYYFLVIAPRWIRIRFGISDQLFFRSRDTRLDYTWVPIDRSIIVNETNIDDELNLPNSTIISTLEIMNRELITDLFTIFNTDEVIELKNFNSEVFQKVGIPNNNLIFVCNNTEVLPSRVIDDFQGVFNYKITHDDHLSIDKFRYIADGYEHGLISSMRSPNNLDRTWWLFLGIDEILPHLTSFFKQFNFYFMTLNEEKQVLCVIRFERDGDTIKPPSVDPKNPNVPNNDILTFL